ncbi:toxin-activating lysine-acyltransferase [Pseudomonas fluorescens]|uniref:RTX toxin-activating lysine-acyltransferase n=2 Tax=Pseudomonas fluorescens TaxID=294 RepID=A0A944HDZ4_PSEFL|nr:toxin-activating lysine-acyltransferase [Pseudomonas fluorescens]MBT2308756.1 toxin-activating lysine-acyltransferase [Pseudomonas fluorescens]MBT2312744.1 toxin-activating lysine-acyltransferase [Pseudomonas fluorescens]MBT2317873.1 toxin-activating lysine-acyltransferase [Pseudomonas fluorescens]MBT2330057.1 toxin-activating lysine-acyltransferase [Pseudomonas fluorescens]
MRTPSKLYTYCRSTYSSNRAKLIGFACMIICTSSNYSLFEIMTLRFWIAPAIDHKQILFFFDRNDSPIGYVTWAHLAPDSETRLLRDPNFLLHASEWNEGGRTWIIDFCFPLGRTAEAIRPLKMHFHSLGIDRVFWGRRNSDNSIRRVGNRAIFIKNRQRIR